MGVKQATKMPPPKNELRKHTKADTNRGKPVRFDLLVKMKTQRWTVANHHVGSRRTDVTRPAGANIVVRKAQVFIFTPRSNQSGLTLKRNELDSRLKYKRQTKST